jgi:hypothetical protein
VSRVDYRDKNVRNVPAKLKRVVLNAALAEGVTMADLIGATLGEKYGVVYYSNGRKTQRGDANGNQFMLSLPPEVIDSITREARERRITESSVILDAIAAKYGLIYTPTKKGRRARASSPASEPHA